MLLKKVRPLSLLFASFCVPMTLGTIFFYDVEIFRSSCYVFGVLVEIVGVTYFRAKP